MTIKPKEGERPYSREEVVKIIQSAISNVGADTDAAKMLQQELHVLHDYIEEMRGELAHMRSAEISNSHIPTATDELDAVVEETARATGTIMDACEKIEAIAGTIPGDKGNEITGIVTNIYEACSFQDITGQRINKVVRTLKNIEQRVADILSAFGHGTTAAAVMAVPRSEGSKELLSGPQLKGPAVSQNDIDKLLADFDGK
jgi:chemotaxis protein CheZ